MLIMVAPTNAEIAPVEVVFGHFEIAGFTMHRGMTSEEGLSRDLFRKFEFTFSGHYHHKSDANDIYYLGNPYQLTWQDYGDPRGFHLFDIDSKELTFIQNQTQCSIVLFMMTSLKRLKKLPIKMLVLTPTLMLKLW